jgi:hypothetical protein
MRVLTREKVEKGHSATPASLSATSSFGNATINAGTATTPAATTRAPAAANPVSDILAALSGVDESRQFTWKNWCPARPHHAIGTQEAFTPAATRLHQLGIVNVSRQPGGLSGIAYYWMDVNHDHVITRNELVSPTVSFYIRLHPSCPCFKLPPTGPIRT